MLTPLDVSDVLNATNMITPGNNCESPEYINFAKLSFCNCNHNGLYALVIHTDTNYSQALLLRVASSYQMNYQSHFQKAILIVQTKLQVSVTLVLYTCIGSVEVKVASQKNLIVIIFIHTQSMRTLTGDAVFVMFDPDDFQENEMVASTSQMTILMRQMNKYFCYN